MRKKSGLSQYWDSVGRKIQRYYLCPTLEAYRDWEISRLLERWVPSLSGYLLKTDSFEEAFGETKSVTWFTKRFGKVVCVDISPAIAQHARENNVNNKLSWAVADISHMPFADEAFDLIFSTNTYGYLKHVLLGLKEARRILKGGGVFIITVRNRLNLIAQTARYFKRLTFEIPDAYMIKDFNALLESSGFRVSCCEPIVHIPPGIEYIVAFLENKKNSICKGILRILLLSLKYYSQSKTILRYFTAWSVIFKAEKENDSCRMLPL